jgi:dGTPase
MEHVLHVASAARTVARCLGLNEDLTEAIGLGHDIGHAPFGHRGENVLNDIIRGANGYLKGIVSDLPQLRERLGGFHHEIYGLRVVDNLALLDREGPGLNLTWEVRDGIASHCGEDLQSRRLEPSGGHKNLETIRSRADVGSPSTLEGCIVRMVDKIVYAGRDVEDAIATDVIRKEDVPQEIRKALGENNGEVIGTFVEDLITSSFKQNYAAISEERGELLQTLLDFNYENIYNSDQAKIYAKQAERCLELLFETLWKEITSTDRYRKRVDTRPLLAKRATLYQVFKRFVEDTQNVYTEDDPDSLIVLDFVAGMTDNFAVHSFQELFIPQATV